MFSHSPSSKKNNFKSSKSLNHDKLQLQTEEHVLFNYIPCIPSITQDINIQEVINKSQIQYQQQQQQYLLSLKRSSEHLDQEKEKQNNSSYSTNNQQTLLNTPLYTKIVIDKIVNQLTCPSDDLEVELHILHMKQLVQEQEKTIQRAMIEGEKTRFNRKACEFSSVERENPQKYDAGYYEQQLQLQQQYLKGSWSHNKNNADISSTQQQPQFVYPQSNRDQGAFDQSQRFLSDNSHNILQSRCSNIAYTSSSNNVVASNSKAPLSNANNLGQQNIYNDNLKQNSNQQNSQVSYQQQQQTNLVSQQENNQESKYKTSSKNNKENKSSSAGKENSGSSVGIINSKISKDNKNKKRAQTQTKIQQNQNISSMENNATSSNLPQLHQQMSAPPQIGQQQVPINQQQSTPIHYNRYPVHQQQNQQFYGTAYGFKNMYQLPHQNPIYYNQSSYTTPNYQPYLYPQNQQNAYYYPQVPAQRITTNFQNQYCIQSTNNNNNNNNNSNSNQPLFPKQEPYIEENGDIASQIEIPLMEINNNINNSSSSNNNNNNNNNNHSLNQSNYEDFFRNQDQDQQLPLQPHISRQMSLQQSSLEDQLDQGEDDDMINNYLS
ncbi:hypothetical protein TTHERM_00486710 (macronuclear) [Tetrahymena thermophila SB210]|uniref:Uncharacterized protein n=1 Tax=Tetrahymena thermophila (strain SB210) TaxID=312017 RepID=I7M000_TETTS|nr:hypothetical protein TTHERM_00486710 [Tetrahymena thermophila SB210]EAR85220.1 hypothetical protein TTHERM_00486710 [Tetrahymena thermophila SB210]|eukprot:XP_001032883.1 hypothetical protein TTHERM_00486710 [Tetrahymena thermophila SB210]